MSATIDNELFRYYFAADHVDNILSDGNFYTKIIEAQTELQKKKEKQRLDLIREDDPFDSGF